MTPPPNIFHPDEATVLLILSALVIPFLASLIARAHWDQFWTGAITGLLSVVNGVLTPWLAQGPTFDWQTAFTAALLSWATSIVITRSGVLRATGVDAKLLAFPDRRPTVTAGEHERAA